MDSDEQYQELCDKCNKVLGIDVGIYIMEHKSQNKEKTVCSNCHSDYDWSGWRCDLGDEECDHQ